MGVGMIFSRWGPIVDFPSGSINDFSRGTPKVVKLQFTQTKLRKLPFFAENLIGKCKISKSRGCKTPLPTPSDTHDC